MPELQDLERLKSEIIHLAQEPSVLERRGIKLPDISVPEQEEDQELSQLLQGLEEDFGAFPEEEPVGFEEDLEPEPEEPEKIEEFGTTGGELEELLGGFDEVAEEFGVPVEEFEEPSEPEESSEFEGIPEFVEPAEIEDFSGFEEPEPAGFEEETVGIEEAFSGLEEEFSISGEEFSGEEEPAAPESVAAAGGEEEAFDQEDFSLPEEFELDEDLFGEGEIPDFSVEQGEEAALIDAEEAGVEFPLPEFGEEIGPEAADLEEPDTGVEEFGEMEEFAGAEEFGTGEEIEVEGFEEGPIEDLEAVGEEIGLSEEGMETGPERGGLEELELPEEEFEEGEFEIDEFNLGDLGEEFGVLEEGEQEIALSDVGEGAPVIVEEETPIELSDEEFQALSETLLTLPRNLKLIVEEQIGERGLSGPPLRGLISALVQRRSPKEIAQIASKITGRRIKIPTQYEKKTGAAFEAEKESFAYAFRYRILPLIRTITLSALVIGLFIFLGVRYVYKPLYALHLYNQGYEQLLEREYVAANGYFRRGEEQAVMRKQYFRYAEGFEEQKQWLLAEEKYEQLLTRFPYDKEGVLAYAGLELNQLSDYRKASEILQEFLNEEPRDYDASLLLGDTYLEWGEEDPEKYDQARFMYAVLMENYGVSDTLLFRMLRYFVRTDNFDEVMNLKSYYDVRPEVEVEPTAYTELGGYLIDRNRLKDVRDVLLRSKGVDDSLPETHYQLARYFHLSDEGIEEEKALRYTLTLMQNISPMTKKRIAMKVDTYRRYGELQYGQGKYLDARSNYNKGIELYEKSLARKLIEPAPHLGKIYAGLADIHYYQAGEYEDAESLYAQAERNGYDSPEMKYKQGFISYRNEDYRMALLRFQRSAGSFSTNHNLMFATANTLFRRGNYQTSQGYYSHLVELLGQELEREVPLLIDERQDHQALVENLMRTSNNLGVTYYNLYRKTGQTDYYTRAMVQFSDSSRYFDRLTRDPDTLERVGLSNLGYVNQRNLLYPQREYELQIYADIPLDMRRLELGL